MGWSSRFSSFPGSITIISRCMPSPLMLSFKCFYRTGSLNSARTTASVRKTRKTITTQNYPSSVRPNRQLADWLALVLRRTEEGLRKDFWLASLWHGKHSVAMWPSKIERNQRDLRHLLSYRPLNHEQDNVTVVSTIFESGT